jgi:hypothetical protein
LIILPIGHCANDVLPLRALAASAQEHDGRFSGSSVVHPIPWANIDLELPHTISTKRVITEVIVCKPVNATEDCGLSARIPQRPKPFTERVFVLWSDVLEDFRVIFAYKRITVKASTMRNPLTTSVYTRENNRQFK